MTSADWPFPFPAPGRPRPRAIEAKTGCRWPFTDLSAVDGMPIAPRHVRAPIPGAEFLSRVAEYADDVTLGPEGRRPPPCPVRPVPPACIGKRKTVYRFGLASRQETAVQ